MTNARKTTRASWGKIRKLPSGRYQASYVGPDSERHTAPMTYSARREADAWLATQRAQIVEGTWTPSTARAKAVAQATRAQTFSSYSTTWIPTRTNRSGEPLRPRTVEEYERLIAGPLESFASVPITSITPASVRAWRAEQIASGRITQTSRAYDLLRAVLNTAVEDGLISANPCRVKGGGSASTRRTVLPPTDRELQIILDAIEPRYAALIVLAANGGLRFGEATELRRQDVKQQITDGPAAVRVSVTRAVTRTTAGGFQVGRPKSEAGSRNVAIFGADALLVVRHLTDYTGPSDQALLFAAADGVSHLAQSAFYRSWNRARRAAGRPDMPFHALRHYAGTRYAQAGATSRETMARLGHSSLGAAMRYQHAGNRDDELAARMARR